MAASMKMTLLVLDNYDSFTYNLVHALETLGDWSAGRIDVIRNDKITLDEVDAYDHILLSPGPGIPEEAGIMPALIERYAPTKRILGVCLGHQAIAEAFGGALFNMSEVVHGKHTPVRLLAPRDSLFEGLSSPIQGGRYHSWLVTREGLPEVLRITAEDEDGQIMALCHTSYDVKGIQFHPESVMTPEGKTILANWLKGA